MKLTKTQHKWYDFVMSGLAVLEVTLIVLYLSGGLSRQLHMMYRIILLVFWADYGIRFFNAPDRKKFVIHNICDLIALIPIRTLLILGGLHAPESIMRFCTVPRMVALLYRPFRKTSKMLETNGFKYVVFISVSLILTGGILIHFSEGMSIEDGIWWAFVTTTTVGYGDLSPATAIGRLIAMALMIVGIGLIGSLTSTLTAYFMGEKKLSAKDQIIRSIQEQLTDFDQLTAEDVSHICTILTVMKQKGPKELSAPQGEGRTAGRRKRREDVGNPSPRRGKAGPPAGERGKKKAGGPGRRPNR